MVDLKLYVWVVKGLRRVAMIKAFGHPMSATMLRKKALHYNPHLSLNNVCDQLRRFLKLGIAECLTPEEGNGKIYQLTPDGEEIRQALLRE